MVIGLFLVYGITLFIEEYLSSLGQYSECVVSNQIARTELTNLHFIQPSRDH